MVLNYNKTPTAKPGRGHLTGKGPRDNQLRSINADLVDKLQGQLFAVTKALEERDRQLKDLDPAGKMYSQAEFEAALHAQLVIELEKRGDVMLDDPKVSELELQVDELKSKVVILETQLEAKQETIDLLSKRPIVTGSTPSAESFDPEAPTIDRVFIDPTESDSMESHINIEETKDDSSSGEKLDDSISKLKNILG